MRDNIKWRIAWICCCRLWGFLYSCGPGATQDSGASSHHHCRPVQLASFLWFHSCLDWRRINCSHIINWGTIFVQGLQFYNMLDITWKSTEFAFDVPLEDSLFLGLVRALQTCNIQNTQLKTHNISFSDGSESEQDVLWGGSDLSEEAAWENVEGGGRSDAGAGPAQVPGQAPH